MRRTLDRLLYFPTRPIRRTPAAVGAHHVDVEIASSDGVILHGWWVPAVGECRGHVLFAHGAVGNIGDCVLHVALLAEAGFDVLAFDYRGYGSSSGTPDETGTYQDARAALRELARRDGVHPGRVFYAGESMGGAILLELALTHPPAGLILTSPFTSVRDVVEAMGTLVPRWLVPDAYPSLRRISALRSPLLVMHGSDDSVVPLASARQLFGAAPEPKTFQVIDGAGHTDVVLAEGAAWAERIVVWTAGLRAHNDDRPRAGRYVGTQRDRGPHEER
ncbi:lysophospholipase [Nocardia sp. CDC159]|uniref:Lysophospholipase n=1 Tax=Nocardia pulmonis TaxID=2951408 RepID=A0A9X2EBY1_9NOCA|nr:MULTISPECIES: alpha/beta fold hydrolase [Nocardia]MCM6776655.1 lysophospholipase [Nocardia pulmonis]MCM6789196.1 lysophospholipase [Nocardia sp. CDC159]